MAPAFLFDLDMTLVDSSALASLRTLKLWSRVHASIGSIKAFPGDPRPHALPGLLRKAGHKVAIVTSSPETYAVAVLKHFGIEYDALVSFNDTTEHKPDPAPILAALRVLGASADNAFYVGDSADDFEASHNAGVASIGVAWPGVDPEPLASTAPDIYIKNPQRLLGVDSLVRRIYLGELACAGVDPLLHWGSVLRCGGTPTAYALGRYFTGADARHATGKLTQAILTLKSDDAPAATLGPALRLALDKLKLVKGHLVPVPPKPSQTRQRFEALLAAAAPTLPVILDGLRAVKDIEDYKKLRPDGRAAAIRGAFETTYEWKKNRVILVDDVLTTGNTTAECARVLLDAGASEVVVLALAKDQRAFGQKECPQCQRKMRVKTNRYSQAKFWGCSGYPECSYSEDMT
jgi:HAD superfamily hydrolase (TIGR01549 family)